MTFREVSVVSLREILRLWLAGHRRRAIARHAQVDRKTVRRYVDAAVAAGLRPGDPEDKLTDELLGQILDTVKPGHRPGERGAVWLLLTEHSEDFIKPRLEKRLQLITIHKQLQRHISATVPYSTFHRFCVQELGYASNRHTVRVADCQPGSELQVDFGRMGLLFDIATQRMRVCHALIFTAVFSRHTFVYLTFSQRFENVIGAFEAAWDFYGGIFRVVIPDNIKAIVDQANPLNPRLNDAFIEYAQARGFIVDPARVRKPRDKARVERVVRFVRESFFKGEDFLGLDDAQRRAVVWCLQDAGMRIHGTTHKRPKEVFEAQERQHLLPAPHGPYDIPVWCEPKVHPDRHIEVAKALYSVPGEFVGLRVKARADAQLVKVFYKGKLIKTHPRKPPGGRSTDATDLPAHKAPYAMRDINYLKRAASSHGANVGTYAARMLDIELPWTRMRQVYRLLGLVRRFGPERVDEACAKALELEVVDVSLIARMLERALESRPADDRPAATVVPMRFARADHEFRARRERDGDDG
jgi:transposase